MKPDSTHDPELAELLRRQAAAAPISDAGFTQRVMAALPPVQPRRAPLPRAYVYVIGALAGLALALPHSATRGADLGDGIAAVVELFVGFTTDPKLSLALGLTLGGLAFAYAREIRARLWL